MVESVRRGLAELKTPGRSCEEVIREIYRLEEFKHDLMSLEGGDIAALWQAMRDAGLAAVTQVMRDAVERFIRDRYQPF